MKNTIKRVLWTLFPIIIGIALVRLGSSARVTVTWETASEVDAAGFRLYRSDTPDGPFTLLSADLILAKGDPLVGEKYSYEDIDVTWGKRYYYQLEEISLNGTADRYPQTVTASAGLGWHWAFAAGSALGLVGFLTGHRKHGASKLDEDQETRLWTGA